MTDMNAEETVVFDHSDPAMIPVLHETYRDLRDRCPVPHGEKFGGFWALTRYDDVQKAARDAKTFTTTQGITIPSLHGRIPMIPAGVDPPEHTKYRRVLQPFFMPVAMPSYEGPLRAVARASLAKVASNGEADLVQVLGRTVPPVAITSMFGLPLTDAERFMDWTERLMATGFAGDLGGNEAVTEELEDYLEDACLERRGRDDGSILAAIANATVDDRPLTSDEVRGMTHLLAVAGHETTVNAIGTMLYHVATQPGLKRQLLDDPASIPAMVEEALRYDSAVMSMSRTVVTETEIGGQTMEPGDKVLLAYISANRDDRHFDRPDEFVVPRESNTHLAFGSGVHKCIGEHLARLEMRIVTEEVLRAMPDFEIAPGYQPDWLPARTVRGLRSLPVRFTPWEAT
jgi:cytochrome P450